MSNECDQEWHHIVVSVEPLLKTTYVLDGVVRVNRSPSIAIELSDGPLALGNNPEALARQWEGMFDDVAMWNRALTAEEMELIYTSGLAGRDLADTISSAD